MEILSIVSLPFKELSNTLSVPYLDVGMYFLNKESDSAAYRLGH